MRQKEWKLTSKTIERNSGKIRKHKVVSFSSNHNGRSDFLKKKYYSKSLNVAIKHQFYYF